MNKNHEAMHRDHRAVADEDGAAGSARGFGLPNLQARMLRAAQAATSTANSVASAVAKWDALDLEAAIDEARVCGGMVRSDDEWLAHPHGQVLAAKPIVEIIEDRR